MKAGTYNAKVVSHAISETKAGDPQATVTFSFEAEGTKSITWYGSFKEAAAPITLKSLLVCGLKGNNPAGPLDIGREVSIVIEADDYKGKSTLKVRWVNALGGVRNVIPQDAAKAKLSALEGAVMAARQDLGLSDDDEMGF